jgi:hypothetical protein
MEKGVRIGDRVKVNGKLGLVYEVLGNEVHVKFDGDGTYVRVFYSSVEPELINSSWKSTCPFCKSLALEVKSEKAYGADKVYQCEKCTKRFSQ